jgi:hypothetical protein
MRANLKIKINSDINNINTNSLDTLENLDRVLDFPLFKNNSMKRNTLSSNKLQKFDNTSNNNKITTTSKSININDKIKKKLSILEKTQKDLEKNSGAAKHGKVFTKFDDKAFLSKI